MFRRGAGKLDRSCFVQDAPGRDDICGALPIEGKAELHNKRLDGPLGFCSCAAGRAGNAVGCGLSPFHRVDRREHNEIAPGVPLGEIAILHLVFLIESLSAFSLRVQQLRYSSVDR
jgi:hypothetical protein